MAEPGDNDAKLVMAAGSYAERLVCHGRLPLIAGLDSGRPAVHVWEYDAAGLREIGAVDADAAEYPPEPWKRHHLVPSVAWHPHEPRLLVAKDEALRQWTPDGTSAMAGTPAGAKYGHVAFSPDGSTVFASPSSTGDQDDEDDDAAWQRSDAFDPERGELLPGPRWDTAIVEHPGSGLVATLWSNQGATDLLFARPDDTVPVCLRVLRNTIILDADLYEAPIFSPNGRFLAIRGNAYVNSLDVFEFPTLRKVLHTELGDPYPGYPYPTEWLEEQSTWSRHNVAFTPRSGDLLVATPKGRVVEIDLDREQAVEHQISDAPISALAVVATGHLVLADRSGRVTVMTGLANALTGTPADQTTARQRVAAFLASTTELSADADLDVLPTEVGDRDTTVKIWR